jgi:DNA-binding GntR family transcriptional regulator
VSSPPVRTSSLRHRAYDHLQAKIFSGEITPGQVLSETILAAEMGISRTPLREAIRTLEQEGVLEQVPRFGTVVRKLNRKDLVELFQLRIALEPFAVGEASGHLVREDIDSLRRFCDEIDILVNELKNAGKVSLDGPQMGRLLSADLGFHLLILRAAGNERLLKIVRDSRVLAGIFGTPRQEHTVVVLKETAKFHRDILAALEVGQGDSARRLMEDHIRLSLQQSLDHFDRQDRLASRPALDSGLPSGLRLQMREMAQPSKAKSKAVSIKVRKK